MGILYLTTLFSVLDQLVWLITCLTSNHEPRFPMWVWGYEVVMNQDFLWLWSGYADLCNVFFLLFSILYYIIIEYIYQPQLFFWKEWYKSCCLNFFWKWQFHWKSYFQRNRMNWFRWCNYKRIIFIFWQCCWSAGKDEGILSWHTFCKFTISFLFKL